MNLKLVKLTPAYRRQLEDMMEEWLAKEQHFSPYAIRKNDYRDFDRYLACLENTTETEEYVPDSVFFCLDTDRDIFVGAVNIRHKLNARLLESGGHIGDGVRPSERRKGVATRMIALALDECRKLGIDRVLMTCDRDNIGSAKSIQRNGGVLEGEVLVDGVPEQRYWIDLRDRVMVQSAQKRLIDVPTDSCHAGTVARFRGRTYLAWFGGTREGAPDVDIFTTCLGADGTPGPIHRVSAGGFAHWNPVLLPREDGLTLFFKYGPEIPSWRTMRVELDEEAAPLTAPREAVPGDVGGRGPVKNKCLRLKSGRVLAPASLERRNPDRWDPYVDISDDGGATFSRFVPIPLLRPDVAQGAGAIQPSLWQDGETNAVHALMRSTEGCLLRSDSTDEGETWTPARRTDIPNNNSGIDLARLPDGRILLCLNPVSGNWAARTPLALWVSSDNGETFSGCMQLETDPGEYSYPGLVAEGNTLYLIYTWNRQKMALWEITLKA